MTAKDGCIDFMFLGHSLTTGSAPMVPILRSGSPEVLKTRDGNLEVYSVVSANVSPFIRRSNPWDVGRDLMQPNLKSEKLSRSHQVLLVVLLVSALAKRKNCLNKNVVKITHLPQLLTRCLPHPKPLIAYVPRHGCYPHNDHIHKRSHERNRMAACLNFIHDFPKNMQRQRPNSNVADIAG